MKAQNKGEPDWKELQRIAEEVSKLGPKITLKQWNEFDEQAAKAAKGHEELLEFLMIYRPEEDNTSSKRKPLPSFK